MLWRPQAPSPSSSHGFPGIRQIIVIEVDHLVLEIEEILDVGIFGTLSDDGTLYGGLTQGKAQTYPRITLSRFEHLKVQDLVVAVTAPQLLPG